MKSVDRVFSAIEHEEPDRVPSTDHIYISQSLEGILGRKGVRTDTSKEYVEVHRSLGLDLICAFPDTVGTKSSTLEETIDEWGVKCKVVNRMFWYLEGPIRIIDDFKKYSVPDPSLPIRFRSARQIARLVKGDLAIAGIVDGPFTRSWLLSGFDLFVRAIYSNQGAVQRILQEITEYAICLGEGFIEAGVDILWIPDDLGTVDGPFLSPETFRRTIFPFFNRIVDSFKKSNVKVLLHSNGQIMPLIEDLIQIGFDGVHPIERKAGMNLGEIKARYGEELTLIGNVDATKLLPYGREKEIKAQVLECLETGAPGGGYILASDHSIHGGIPPKNARLMFKLARQYGKYPIRTTEVN